MATELESLVISARLENAALTRGVAESVREIEQLVTRTGSGSTPITLDFRLAPIEKLKALTAEFQAQGTAAGAAYVAALDRQLERIADLQAPPIPTPQGSPIAGAAAVAGPTVSPQALEAFSQAAVGSFQQVAQAITALNATVAEAAGLQRGFFEGLAEGARELTALATQSTQAGAAVERLAAIPAPQLNVAPAIAATDTLIARLGLVQRSATIAREVLSQPITIPTTAAASLEILSQGLIGQRTRADEALAANERLTQIMLQQGQAARRAAGDNAAAAAAIGSLGRQQLAVTGSAATATRGLNTVRGGLTAIAVTASGTNARIGQLVSGLLLMGTGSTVVLGLAAGAAIIALVIDRITSSARKAREELDTLNESLDQAIAGRNPLAGLTTSAEALTRQLGEVNAQLTGLRSPEGQVEFRADPRSGIVSQIVLDNTAQIARLEAERAAILARMLESGRQLSEFFANTPAAKALAEAAEEEARARERAAEAARRQLEDMLGIQKAIRVSLAGGGNLTQGAGSLPIPPAIEIPVVLKGARELGLESGEGDAIQAELLRAAEAADALQLALFGVNLELRDIGNANIDDPAVEAAKLNDAIHDVTRGLDEVAGAALNVGLIGEEAARAIGDVLNLADALADVAKEASSGNILGLVGAGIGLLGGLLGPSAAELERNRILERNNQLLEQNNARLAAEQGAAGLAGLGVTAEMLAAQQTLLERAQTGGGTREGTKARAELDQILAAAGASIEEFARQVELTTGIEILDDKGRVVAAAFDQAAAAIDQMVEAATHFGTSLADRSQVLATRDALGLGPNAGLPDDVAGLARTRELELGGLELDPALEQSIAGLNLETEAGRQAFLEFNRMLFTMAESGQLTAEQLGTFTSVQELLGPINDAATGIDAFSESVAEATKALSNIPEFFNLGAAELEAQRLAPAELPEALRLVPPPVEELTLVPPPVEELTLVPPPLEELSLDQVARFVGGGTDG